MQFKTLRKSLSILIALTLVLFLFVGCGTENYEQVNSHKEKETLIEEYISILAQADITNESNEDVFNIEQHEIVIEQFGKDAWENVLYDLEKIDPIDGELGYRIIASDEYIDAAEYDRLLREYWENVAKKEGISYYDIFLEEGEPESNLQYKRTDILSKYSQDIPVELTLISDEDTYRVNLSFNDIKVSKEGYKDFHFIIDNSKGEWQVYEGLTWTAPQPEFPEGD